MPKVRLIPCAAASASRSRGACSAASSGVELPNAGTYGRNDYLWVNVFGSPEKVAAFLARGEPITRRVALGRLYYDPCDRVLTRSAKP